MNTYNPNKLYINKKNFIHNLNEIKNIINSQYFSKLNNEVDIMPVIKADAYGLGIENILPILNELDIKIVGVANVEEAIKVRQLFSGEIIVLSQPFKEQIPEIIKYNIIPVVSDIDFLEVLNKYIRNISVHIKIDTGMNRTGIRYDNLEQLVDIIPNLKNINIEGILTHFSSSSSDIEFTKSQIEIFNQTIEELKNKLPNLNFKYIHFANSGGILNYNNLKTNLVRTGILMYGYSPGCENKINNNFNFRPVLEFKTQISHIHYVKQGESIGYDRVYKAEKNMKLAILPLGYADAFIGLKSNKAHVLINNQEAKIIAICMNVLIVDISEINNVEIGEEVILLDNTNISIEDWANWTNCIKYEILTGFSKTNIEKVII